MRHLSQIIELLHNLNWGRVEIMLLPLGTVDPIIWVAIIGSVQVLIVTFGANFIRNFNNKDRKANEDREQIVKQLTPSNGVTLATYVEAINEKVNLIDEKVDGNHEITMIRLTKHEKDDEERFNSLEQTVKDGINSATINNIIAVDTAERNHLDSQKEE
jgi:hypothetical protein